MKIIPPLIVTPTELTSNVEITEEAWAAGTYDTGVERYVGTDLYEVVAVPNTDDEPTAGAAKDPPTWLKIGKINRFKMFDFIIGEATEVAEGGIEVTLEFPTVVNALAIFEADAETVRVFVTDGEDGIVYDQTKTMQDFTGVGDWYQYFFAPYATKSDLIFSDLPAYAGASITVQIQRPGGAVAVGELILGRIQVLGVTLQNFTFGIEDFSRKERDAFGNFTIVERRFAKVANYDVFLNNTQVNATFLALAKVRATPVVYIGNAHIPETITLGFYRGFSTLRTGPVSSEMSLEIEGLV